MKDEQDINQLKQLLCFNVYSLNRAFARFYQAAFSETGLTYPKFVILQALEDAGPLSVSALSNLAGVEPNTLSPLLKKMAEFDVVTRKRSAEDERRVDIAITPKGKEGLKRARAVILKGFDDLGLDDKQVSAAIEFLKDTRSKVDQADPPKLSLDGIG